MTKDLQKHRMLTKAKLILYRDSGLVNKTSLVADKELMALDPQLNHCAAMLLDFSNAKIKLTTEEMEEHAKYIDTHPQWKRIKKFAILTQTPSQVAKALLYKKKARESSAKYEAFSTIEAALKWLKIPLTLRPMVLEESKEFFAKLKS